MRQFSRVVVAMMLTGSILSACSEEPSPPQSLVDDVDVTGLNLKADIDRDSWMITLPADRFGISRDEEDIISSAYMGASMTCYKKYAPDQIWVDLPPLSGLNTMNPPVFSEFGVWRVGMA